MPAYNASQGGLSTTETDDERRRREQAEKAAAAAQAIRDAARTASGQPTPEEARAAANLQNNNMQGQTDAGGSWGSEAGSTTNTTPDQSEQAAALAKAIRDAARTAKGEPTTEEAMADANLWNNNMQGQTDAGGSWGSGAGSTTTTAPGQSNQGTNGGYTQEELAASAAEQGATDTNGTYQTDAERRAAEQTAYLMDQLRADSNAMDKSQGRGAYGSAGDRGGLATAKSAKEQQALDALNELTGGGGSAGGYASGMPGGEVYMDPYGSTGWAENIYNQQQQLNQRGMQTMQGATLDTAQSNEARAAQMALQQQLGDTAAGRGMSAAQIQLQAGQDQAMKQAMALAASNPAVSGALAQRMAGEQQGEILAATNQQAAQLRAQEAATAQGLMAQNIQGVRSTDAQQAAEQAALTQQTQATNLQAQMQQQQELDAMTQYYTSQGMSIDQAKAKAQQEYYRMLLEAQLEREGYANALTQSEMAADTAERGQNLGFGSALAGAGLQAAGSIGASLLQK